MIKLAHIPYPRPSWRTYAIIGACIAFTVSFILIVFQPFGTAQFQHPNKRLILLGYGLTIFATLAIFYGLSTQLIHRQKESRWTILQEGVDLFLALFLSLLASYFYSIGIFNGSFDWKSMSYFLLNAATVAILPVVGAVFYLYHSWKDVQRASLQTEESDSTTPVLLLIGNNQGEQIETAADEIILAQAQSNYVMLYLRGEERPRRHILRSTLKQVKDQLSSAQFLQVHRSFIVNRKCITQLTGNKSKASLHVGGMDKTIPVSRAIYDQLKGQQL